jgi:hypothetical protein
MTAKGVLTQTLKCWANIFRPCRGWIFVEFAPSDFYQRTSHIDSCAMGCTLAPLSRLWRALPLFRRIRVAAQRRLSLRGRAICVRCLPSESHGGGPDRFPVLVRGRHHDINVLENRLGRDTRCAVRGFHEVVSCLSAMLATERIRKCERLTQLSGSN